jgi:hypothetical protein
MKPSDLERDAFLIAREVWAHCLEGPTGTTFCDVLDRVGNAFVAQGAVLDRIRASKLAFNATLCRDGGAPPPARPCCVFFCCAAGTTTQNSLSWCAIHRGLSLLNATRHRGKAGLLLNLLLLRDSPKDDVHKQTMEEHIYVPLGMAGHERRSYAIRKSCRQPVPARGTIRGLRMARTPTPAAEYFDSRNNTVAWTAATHAAWRGRDRGPARAHRRRRFRVASGDGSGRVPLGHGTDGVQRSKPALPAVQRQRPCLPDHGGQRAVSASTGRCPGTGSANVPCGCHHAATGHGESRVHTESPDRGRDHAPIDTQSRPDRLFRSRPDPYARPFTPSWLTGK